MIKKLKYALLSALAASMLNACTLSPMSEQPKSSSLNSAIDQSFFEKRAELITKYSSEDNTFAALQTEQRLATTYPSEYWRWRIDQYLYGQYPEYQPIYDAFTEGKQFNEIYDLPKESLGKKWVKPTKLPAIPKAAFTDNLPGNAYTGWHQLVGNKIYTVYQGHLTDPYVASYDLETKEWDGPYKAGHSTLSKGERKIDSHGRPIIEVDNQGYVHIVFGGHGGEREDGLNPFSIDTPHAGGRMTHVVSAKPNDLSKFIVKDDITPFASYTASYKMANGDIYFFTRAGTHKSPWVYYKMKNGSQTFEPPVKITWPTPQKNDPITVDTHYINPLKVSDTEIVITSLWHACNFNETHDKTNYGRLNLYYMKLDTTTDTFYNAHNEKLNLPLTLADTNKHTLAYDSEKAQEISFGTKPLILDDGRTGAAYEARGEGYREWRMALFEEGKWTHGHPMPGTVNQVVHEENGNRIKRVYSLQVIKQKGRSATAAVAYRNAKGENVFGIAKQISASGDSKKWQIQKTHFSIAKAKIQMSPVKNERGDVVALIINVRKGKAQRLYLWHDGEFRANL
ncbi:BNR-4 repeat-containing protein [Algibacillus agarilyticus]|uniref:BNR-4 repeat-containing protein n=1 Tax=Algibacillus agarilyticus TaxID=2234133 RepID=UPI000DCFACAD|nr:BNR-4 repeat-containing protein [Algibacillus agarilyticus]